MTDTIVPLAPPDEQRTEHPYVTRSDRVLGGVPILRGTRIPVRLIAQMYRAGDSVDDILQSYAHLSPAAVHDALRSCLRLNSCSHQAPSIQTERHQDEPK